MARAKVPEPEQTLQVILNRIVIFSEGRVRGRSEAGECLRANSVFLLQLKHTFDCNHTTYVATYVHVARGVFNYNETTII